MQHNRSEYPILVVDDDPGVVKLFERIYSDAGFPVKAITNPLQTIDLLHSFRPVVVTLDIDMPERNGLDVLQDIRDTRLFVSVIVVSAHTTVANRIEAFNRGADYIIAKPLRDPAHLLDYTERCITRMDDWLREIREIGRLEAHTG